MPNLASFIYNQGEKISFGRTGVKYTGDINSPVYNKVWSGNSLNLVLVKNVLLPIDINIQNLLARGASCDWNENYNILPIVEYNEYFINEQVLGLQDLGRGTIASFETLRIGDAMPNVRTLPYESEITMFSKVGDDHPNHGMVLNVFFGVRIVSQSGSFNPTSIAARNIGYTYRYRLPGKDYANIDKTSPYPGAVKEMPLDAGVPA